MIDEELFWNTTIEELSQGYILKIQVTNTFCLIYGQRFENGVIYPSQDILYEAKKAIKIHISDMHNSVFDYLLDMDKKYTGITEHQKDLLNYFKQGLTDKEIIAELGVVVAPQLFGVIDLILEKKKSKLGFS